MTTTPISIVLHTNISLILVPANAGVTVEQNNKPITKLQKAFKPLLQLDNDKSDPGIEYRQPSIKPYNHALA